MFDPALRDDFRPSQGDIDPLVIGAVKNPYVARAIGHEKQLLYAT
jgi:hypothetical protein